MAVRPNEAQRGLTNGRDFPAPSSPRSGDRQQRAKMGSANSHQLTQKGKSHVHYCDRYRSCEECFRCARREPWGYGAAAPTQGRPHEAAAADCGTAAHGDRDGGVFGCALLGASVPGPWPHGALDGAQAGHAVPDDRQARQERRGRRGGDLRSDATPEHAFRADQDRGPASQADGAPLAARLCHRAYGLHQPHPRPAQRVWHRVAAQGRGGEARGALFTSKTCPAMPTW